MTAIWLIPALPLLGFLVLLVFGRRLGDPAAGWLATVICAVSFAVSAAVFFELLSRPSEERAILDTVFTWVAVGGLQIDVAFLADPLSIAMALFITGVGALIHLYAIGYMHGDPKFSKFFLYLNLFVFSMLLLVLGDNLLVTFVGWEGVGTCSYLLISFWHHRNSAAVAAKKAFVTNRIGDFGFMLAMFMTFQYVGSLNYSELNDKAFAGQIPSSAVTAIALLLFLGATGKSAQIPLFVWLPDAMEGPTPVSALIHAATMVTGGVYLMTRVNPLLAEVPGVGTTIAWIGVITALAAGAAAIAQNDIKRVLAYSTISQLGLMFLAVGSGAYVAAMFLMIVHAFFKALLFLGAGSVIHGVHDEQDMRRMGRLRALMPITAATFIVGWLAIAGVFPLSGFWAKDEVLLYAYDKSPVLWFLGLIVALVTAYYMTRQVIMVFFGEAHWQEPGPDGHAARAPHESPWIMLTPLVVLAVLSAVGGVLNLPGSYRLEHWLEPVVEEGERVLSTATKDLQLTLALVAGVVALAGIGLAWLVYQRRAVKAVEPAVLAHAYYYDEAIGAFVGGPGEGAFQATRWFDETVVDGAVEGVGVGIERVGQAVRRTETGYVRTYALGIGIGAVALLAWFLLRGIA